MRESQAFTNWTPDRTVVRKQQKDMAASWRAAVDDDVPGGKKHGQGSEG